jgi:hypothetical protein
MSKIGDFGAFVRCNLPRIVMSWFRKTPRPPKPAAENPGRGHLVRVAFSSGQKSWEETDDLVASLATALSSLGHKASVNHEWVELEGGFSLLPQVVAVEPRDDRGVKTVSTIQVSHETLVPGGVFEYQHSSGEDVRESFAAGFKSFAELDLPVFLDALRETASDCMFMVMSPGRESTSLPAADRRLVLGPPLQMVQQSSPAAAEHAFCPCCLFTNSLQAFDDLVKDRAFYGIRMFVMRDANGEIEADCRVNGVDWPSGSQALVTYARSWPERGLEYRKQYVCMQTRAPAG